jgi:two-component system, chemotaxis family, protein-glutamate methylesterase/glutaminase
MTHPGAHIEAIAIGGSAGGFDALSTLLQALPARFAPAILVVLHIPPDRPSQLASLFGGRCRLPVREALDKESIEPGTVYVAPPDYHLLVENERMLSLSQDAPVAFSRPSIDVMFESAAIAYRERLLGIVVSGANDDGAAGLAAIREAGGRAWVQDPAEATASAMPAAAVKRGSPELVLPIRDLAERLAHLRSGRLLPI